MSLPSLHSALNGVLAMLGLSHRPGPEFRLAVDALIERVGRGDFTPDELSLPSNRFEDRFEETALHRIVKNCGTMHDDVVTDLVRLGDAMVQAGADVTRSASPLDDALRLTMHDNKGMAPLSICLRRRKQIVEVVVRWAGGTWPHSGRAWVAAFHSDQREGYRLKRPDQAWGAHPRMLLDVGIMPRDNVDIAWSNPLWVAVDMGLAWEAQALVRAGLNPSWLDPKTGDTLFCLAAQSAHREKALLGLPVESLRAIASHANHKGDTPLHQAAAGLSPSLVAYLLNECQVSPVPNARGKLPHQLIRRTGPKAAKNLAEVLRLLQAVLPDTIEPQQRLMMACAGVVVSEVEAALAAGADPNACNTHGSGPLHVIANANKANHYGGDQQRQAKTAQTKCVKALLSAGAKIDMQDKNGNTPLHLSMELFSESLSIQLIEAGASVRCLNKAGQTPLTIWPTWGARLTDSNLSKLVERLVAVLDTDSLLHADAHGHLPFVDMRTHPCLEARLLAHELGQTIPQAGRADKKAKARL